MNTPEATSPHFAAALSTKASARGAVAEVCEQVEAGLGGPCHLAMLFASAHHAADMQRVAQEVQQWLAPACLLGCTAEAVVGNQLEIENEPALSLWAARLPGVALHSMHLQFARTPDGGTVTGWPDDMPAQWPAGAALLLLADPFTFPADRLIERLNDDRPGTVVLGGMASGAVAPGENRLLAGPRIFDEGAVGVLVHGDIRVDAIVSQGCRPIGRPLVVTKADQQLIFELGGRPALKQLEELFAELPPADQRLVQSGLHVGLVINEYQEQFQRGDFLVRNCLGVDRGSGAIAVADFVRTGQTVQFHVRDAGSAHDDLGALLAAAREHARQPAGALLFTCNGRGTRMFDEPHHDATVLRDQLGDLPVAGFFAQGELGPVGGRNFLHGFTASVALFSATRTR